MKIIIISAVFIAASLNPLSAQDVTTVTAKSGEISENLDLEAIASVFGESKDLEEFEKKLNDPKTQISNLDLNGDGEVDYLRVLETSKGKTHVVTIQAVIGKDQYQDVATIDVEKDGKGETQVQVVGDVYMYGPNYIVEPVYVHPPVIFVFFWGSLYRPWRSPYYWGYYPPYYRPWRPYPPHVYRKNVHVHVNINNNYRRTTVRRSNTAANIQKKNRRNDFGAKNPDKSFSNRNKKTKNKSRLDKNGNNNKRTNGKPSAAKKSTGKKVDKNWKSKNTGKTVRQKPKNKSANPQNKPNGKMNKKNNRAKPPAAKPKPQARPKSQPKRKRK